jgi:hypothetical protein
MKKCKKCKVEKPLTEFTQTYNKTYRKYYYQSYCKNCVYIHYVKKQDRRKWVKSWREKQHNGTWKVYILPNAKNYVGYTKAVLPRMYRHKQIGNDTSDYRVLMECNTESDAKELESLLHNMGYPGKHIKKTLTKR